MIPKAKAKYQVTLILRHGILLTWLNPAGTWMCFPWAGTIPLLYRWESQGKALTWFTTVYSISPNRRRSSRPLSNSPKESMAQYYIVFKLGWGSAPSVSNILPCSNSCSSLQTQMGCASLTPQATVSTQHCVLVPATHPRVLYRKFTVKVLITSPLPHMVQRYLTSSE